MTVAIDIPEFINPPHLVLCGDEAEGLGVSYLQTVPSRQRVTSLENIKALKKKFNLLAAQHGPSSTLMAILWGLMLLSIAGFLIILYMSLSFIYLTIPSLVYFSIPSVIRAYRRSKSQQVYDAWESALPEINHEAQKDGFVVLVFREAHKGLFRGLHNYRVYVAESNVSLPIYQPSSELTVPPPAYQIYDDTPTVDMETGTPLVV